MLSTAKALGKTYIVNKSNIGLQFKNEQIGVVLTDVLKKSAGACPFVPLLCVGRPGAERVCFGVSEGVRRFPLSDLLAAGRLLVCRLAGLRLRE